MLLSSANRHSLHNIVWDGGILYSYLLCYWIILDRYLIVLGCFIVTGLLFASTHRTPPIFNLQTVPFSLLLAAAAALPPGLPVQSPTNLQRDLQGRTVSHPDRRSPRLRSRTRSRQTCRRGVGVSDEKVHKHPSLRWEFR